MSRGGSSRRYAAYVAMVAWLYPLAGARAERAPLALVVEGYDDDASERLRAAIERELGRPVARQKGAPAGEVSIVVQRGVGRDVTITHVSPDGRRLDRWLRVQGDEARAEGEVALLAGNLARDESASLIAGLPKAAAEPSGHDAEFSCDKRSGPEIVFGADVAPFVGVSSFAAGRAAARHASLNLFGGLSRGTVAFEGAGFLNVDTEFVCGVQVAGLANVVAGPLRGVQLAGIASGALGRAEGVQLSGFANLARRSMSGLQASGGVNVTLGRLDGAQVGGLASFAAGGVEGFQVSGFFNGAAGPVAGAQIGVANASFGPLSGTQIGLFNATNGRVDGVQIGLINYAEDSEFTLGFINFLSKGRTHLDVWLAPEVGLGTVAIKHGGKHFHYFYGLSLRIVNGAAWTVFGLGGHIPLRSSWFLDIDTITYSQLGLSDIERKQGRGINQLRVVAGHPVARGLSLYGGLTGNVALTGDGLEEPPMYYFYRETPRGADSAVVTVWPGLVLGLQAF